MNEIPSTEKKVFTLPVAGEERERGQEAHIIPRRLIRVTIDFDPEISYERQRWPYILALPIMWILTIWVWAKKRVHELFSIKPKTNSLWFDGLSRANRKIKEQATTCHALDIIYNYQFGRGDLVGDFWINMVNAQAVRNRKKLVVRELVSAIVEAYKQDGYVRLLSIASGSAQAIFEALQIVFTKHPEIIDIKVVFLDRDQKALDKSKILSKEFGFEGVFCEGDTDNENKDSLSVMFEDIFVYIEGDAFHFKEAIDYFGYKPNVVEMVGFNDYLPTRLAITLFRKIYRILSSNGIFLSGNSCPNFERFFMKWVINWDMIYRRPTDMSEIILQAGINADCAQIIFEPHQLHMTTKVIKKP